MKTRRFLIFLNLNYIAKFPNWLVAGCHGNHIKNSAPWFCAQCAHTSSTQVWVNMQHFVFELHLLQCLAYKRRGLVSLPWQPDQNNTHFLKRYDLRSMMIYNTSVILIKFMSKVTDSHPIPP